MLHFFRKHQKIFFVVVTFAVVLSFVFFGTYQAIAPVFHQQSEAETSYLKQMTRFLDTEQWMISKKIFSENFLNDDVISKEFLESGMGEIIASTYPEKFEKEFAERREKEKNYFPYTHPSLPSLSAMHLWSIFAPDIPRKLKACKEANFGFKEKTELFLAQKKFPPAFLSQIIAYQEHNNSQIAHDPRIAREDISLFSYHSLSDWYGEAFMETLSNVIIHFAEIARREGFKVCKDEIFTDLIGRCHEIYNHIKQSVQLPIEDGYGLFQLYLRQNGFSEETVFKIWEDVMLFRRLMHTIGNGAFVDGLALKNFYTYAQESALVELIQMSPECRLNSMEELKRFETYLAAVGEKKSSPLDIPLCYASLDSIKERAPELVGTYYQLAYASINKRMLESKVTAKETLQWQCLPENWEVLKRQFPEFAKKSDTPFDILENLDKKTKKLVDAYTRSKIVALHPEWISEALAAAKTEEKKVFLNHHTVPPFNGIHDSAKFMQALEEKDVLLAYTQDQEHYYRFLIEKRGQSQEILSYQEASMTKILDQLSEKFEGDVLVKAIVNVTPQHYQSNAYVYRFADFIKKYAEHLPEDNLNKQFTIQKTKKTLSRVESFFISLEEAYALSKGNLSEVKADLKEGVYLFRFLEKQEDALIPLEKMITIQEILGREMRCRYLEKMLTQLTLRIFSLSERDCSSQSAA